MMSDEVKAPKYPILDDIEVSEKEIENWQITVDLLSKIANTPAALIMRVHSDEIEVFVSSHSTGNVYHHGEKAPLDSGLYCETVMSTQRELLVPNALKDPLWDKNPDIALGMISYFGLPVTWPGGEIFGTICILDRQENAYSQLIRDLLMRFRDSVQFSLDRIYDISVERKQAKEWEQFLSAVTHELRTPLGPIKVHLDYAVAGKLGPVPEKLKSSLGTMKRSVDRLHGLTNELLDLRRIQAGRLQLNLESMNFREILDGTIGEIEAQTDQKKQRVHLEATEGSLPVYADPVRLGQVLANLVVNASKYTPEGGAITIKVDGDGDTIKCRISDTGIGIRKEDLPKVFEPFANIRKASNIQSTGLGLSVTKGIIEAHGGKIWAESDGEGKGATFTFTIPRLKGE